MQIRHRYDLSDSLGNEYQFNFDGNDLFVRQGEEVICVDLVEIPAFVRQLVRFVEKEIKPRNA